MASGHERARRCDLAQALALRRRGRLRGQAHDLAGGTSGEEASRDIYRFDPVSGSLSRIGLLPHPLTHAAAAAFGGTIYVFGGCEASLTSQTDRILAMRSGRQGPPRGLDADGPVRSGGGQRSAKASSWRAAAKARE